MQFVERLIIVLTSLLVLAAGAGVAFVTYVPVRTGIYKEQPAIDYKVGRWLAKKRGRPVGGQLVHVEANKPRPGRQGVARASSKGAAAGLASKRPAGARAGRVAARDAFPASESAYAVDYFADGVAFPKQEQVPGIPWIRREPGVRYYSPDRIPASLYRRYQSVEAAVDLMKETRGKFEVGPKGSTFMLNGLAKDSYLGSIAGLKAGDRLISVNGIRIKGTGLSAAKAIYAKVKNARHFAVKVIRQGQPTMLTFTVDR